MPGKLIASVSTIRSMKTNTKTLVIAMSAALIFAAPAIVSAERVFFLVGTRHIFRIGTYQYAHLSERRKIEEDYADGVACDQDNYDKAIEGGSDAATEGPRLNRALIDLANERDQRLGAIFENADYERTRHPQLRIEGDAPYQVIGINFHWRGTVEVFDNFIVYAPWPGYVVVDRPYGWSYGVVYSPSNFFNLYFGWHSGFISAGRPAFSGFVGHGGPIGALRISYGPRGSYVTQRLGSALSGGGPFGESRYAGRSGNAGSRYSAGHGTTTRKGSEPRRAAPSKYSSGRTLGSSSHPISHSMSGGYGHSAMGATRSAGSLGHFNARPHSASEPSHSSSHHSNGGTHSGN